MARILVFFSGVLVPLLLLGCGHRPVDSEGHAHAGGSGRLDSWTAEHQLLVTTRDMPVLRDIPATVRSLDHIRVAAEVEGRILATEVEVGERVTAGTLLALIDPTVLQARRDAASAAFDLATTERDRVQRLVEAKVAPDRQRDEAISAWKRARAELAVAEESLARTKVRAPVAGIIEKRWLSPGDLAYPGLPVYSLYDPTRLVLEMQVPVEDRSAVSLGTQLKWVLDGVSGHAEVTEVAPSSDPRSRTLRVRMGLDGQDPNFLGGLAPGAFGVVEYSLHRRSLVLIPDQALIRSGQVVMVRVQGADGEWQRRAVRLGAQFGQEHEVLSGLSAGETIAW